MDFEAIKMLRYNTGTDKKAFIAFKENFDAVLFNATIVAYSGSAIADMVSIYKNKYIIDPQTHILQHEISAIMSKKKTGEKSIKKSVEKYLDQLPLNVKETIEKQERPLRFDEIDSVAEELTEKVFDFETGYVNNFIENKEYNKYLEFADMQPRPRMIIAPYFMLKGGMQPEECTNYLTLNAKCVEYMAKVQGDRGGNYPIATQLVLDEEILDKDEIIDIIQEIYKDINCEYVFLWINDFSSWECSAQMKNKFYKLLLMLNSIKKKPLMSYGGYESILLCHQEVEARIYGVAQSVGYGEKRPITPVGGGIPVNKYYFGPLHLRMNFDIVAEILTREGYFSDTKTDEEHAEDYFRDICDCDTCKKVINNNINNFQRFNDAIPFSIHLKHSDVSRNRPTTEASLIAATHFLYRKKMEWDELKEKNLIDLKNILMDSYRKYGSVDQYKNIEEWCDIFV